MSGATRMLVLAGLVDRLRVRGERADRLRIRPGAWDDQVSDRRVPQALALIAQALEALADAPATGARGSIIWT